MPRTPLLSVIAGALLLEGCATVLEQEAKLDSLYVCDAEMIARVERDARRHNTAVRWMRCPQLAPTQPAPFHHGDSRDA